MTTFRERLKKASPEEQRRLAAAEAALDAALAVDAQLTQTIVDMEEERRQLMLAAIRAGVQYREMAEEIGHAPSWIVKELQIARGERAA